MSLEIENNQPKIKISEFIEKLQSEMAIELLAGSQAIETKEIVSPRIQKLGLALAGFSHYIHFGRVQIVGQSEIRYLNQLNSNQRLETISSLNLAELCCILITKNLEPPRELLEIADRVGLPILKTSQQSSNTISLVTKFLQRVLAPQTTIHGVLLGIFGLGILLTGKSGIGKSECALDLILRGHNLISDDIVLVKRIGDKLEGTSPDLTFEHLEIRGLGIINVRELFGVTAIGKQKKNIDLCVELQHWDEAHEIDRLGLETKQEEIFGVKIAKFVLPVGSGRNVSTLVETAIRVYLLKLNGFDAAQKLVEKHTLMLSAGKAN
jgi:HPr kinase/phosphorylase